MNIVPQSHPGVAVTRKDRVIVAGSHLLLRIVSLREAPTNDLVKMPVPDLQPKAMDSRPESPHASFAQEIPFLFYFSIFLGHIHLGPSSKRLSISHRFWSNWGGENLGFRLHSSSFLPLQHVTVSASAPDLGRLAPSPISALWPSVLHQGRRWSRTPSRQDPAP